MEIIHLQLLIATIVTFAFLLISSRPVILISLLIVLYSLILLERSQPKYYGALALLLFGIFFRKTGQPKAQPTFMEVTEDVTEDSARSSRDEEMTISKINTTSYLDVIRKAERIVEEKKARQLEKWLASRLKKDVE